MSGSLYNSVPRKRPFRALRNALNGCNLWSLILIREYRDFSVKLPKLNAMIDGQPLGLLNCLGVVRANQMNGVVEMVIRID
jgi:hypothetical protein